MIEPARPAALTSILLESYGLTDREVEVVKLLARGLPTKHIAAERSLSWHTVRDHVKTIFGKTNVNSRGELVARLFAEHLFDGFHSAVQRRLIAPRHDRYNGPASARTQSAIWSVVHRPRREQNRARDGAPDTRLIVVSVSALRRCS